MRRNLLPFSKSLCICAAQRFMALGAFAALAMPAVAEAAPGKVRTKEVGGQFCTYEITDRTTKVSDFATFGSDAEDLWVGAILNSSNVSGKKAKAGSFSQLNLPENVQRIPYNIVWKGRSQRVNPPRQAGYASAWGKIVADQTLRSAGAGDISFSISTASDLTQALASVGIKASGISWSASGSVSSSSSSDKNSINIIFVQQLAPFTIDFGAGSAYSGLLAAGASQALQPEWKKNAAYVSSISYGRVLVLKMTSEASIEDMKAAASASYKGVANAKVKGKYTSRQIMKNAQYDIRGYGGNNDKANAIVAALTKGESMGSSVAQYFTSSTRLASLEPITVRLNNFNDNSTISASSPLKTETEQCSSAPAGTTLVNVKYTFYLKKADDGNDDEVYGNFYINGATPSGWKHTSSGKYKQMNAGTYLLMHQDECVAIKSGPSDKDIRDIDIKLWDYDDGSGNDSVFGRFQRQFDYSQAARAIKGGFPVFRDFVIQSSSGNKLSIEFSKCDNAVR
ncbi:MAG: thiol-activated cytolysin family protein [Burkholderiaceae bacterium]